MLNFYLDEAVDNPPAKIADIPSKSEIFQYRQDGSTLSLLSGKIGESERTKRRDLSVLSRWSDRPSVHSFMNAIATLSAKKEQMDLEKRQQQEQMLQNFQKIVRDQEKLAVKQQQMDRNEKDMTQQQHNMIAASPSTSTNDPTYKKSKIRKVMKGGVLVSMPRYPPGTRATEESTRRGEGTPLLSYSDKTLAGGNILDDILARSRGIEPTVTARSSKLGECNKLKLPLDKIGETANKKEQSSLCKENVTTMNAQDAKNIDRNLNLTISMPGKEKVNSEIKHATKMKESSLSMPNKIVPDNNDSFLEENLVENTKDDEMQIKIVQNDEAMSLVYDTENESNTQQCEIISETDNSAENPREKPLSTEKLMPKSAPDEESNIKPYEKDITVHGENFSTDKDITVHGENFSSINSPKSNLGEKEHCGMEMKPEMSSPGCGDLIIDIDSENEFSTSTRRAKKRARCSSFTSESSSCDEQMISPFDRIRSLCTTELSHVENEGKFTQRTAVSLQRHNNNSAAVADDGPACNKDLLSKLTKPIDSNDGATGHKPSTSSEVSTVSNRNASLESYKMRRKSNMEQEASKKERRVEKRKETNPVGDRSRRGDKKWPELQEKNKRESSRQPDYTGCITRSMAHGESPRRRHQQEGKRQPLPPPQLPSLPVLPATKPVVRVVKDVENTPSLLSLVSDEAVDVTVAQQELSDNRKHKKRGGKKKKKKPTEWFLRQKQKEKEMRERAISSERNKQFEREKQLKEPPACLYYLEGKCAKGMTCPFKHEKIKELCRYYVTGVCDKFLSGMCPKLHDEFPCMFFHKTECKTGNTCKFSHEPLNDETGALLEKHLIEMEERRQSTLAAVSPVVSPVITTPGNQTPAIKPTEEKNDPSITSNLVSVTSIPSPGNTHRTSESFKLPNPSFGLNSGLTQAIRKPTVETPKVKRLASLSSYKSPPLSFLIAGIQKVENEGENVCEKTENAASKNFVPGMFKER